MFRSSQAARSMPAMGLGAVGVLVSGGVRVGGIVGGVGGGVAVGVDNAVTVGGGATVAAGVRAGLRVGARAEVGAGEAARRSAETGASIGVDAGVAAECTVVADRTGAGATAEGAAVSGCPLHDVSRAPRTRSAVAKPSSNQPKAGPWVGM